MKDERPAGAGEDGVCPKCGELCGRDEVHNGIAMIYGPWGCVCGWSEWPEYDLSSGRSPMTPGGIIDQYGGLLPLAALGISGATTRDSVDSLGGPDGLP